MSLRSKLCAVLLGVVAFMLFPAGPAFAAEEALTGRLTFEGDAVQGAEITVRDAEGDVVGTAQSGPDGNWVVELPGPGTYEASLDEESLPPDVALRDPERQTLEISVRPNQQRTLLFPLGVRESHVSQLFARVAQASWNGLKFGLIIAITSIGLSLVYGTTRLVNFAHGDMVTFGAIAAWYVNVSGPRIQLIPAAVLAIGAGAALGGLFERALWKPLRARQTGLVQFLVISIGLALLLRYALLFFYGGRPRPYADYTVMSPIRFGPVVTNARDLVVIALSLATLFAVGLMLQKTRAGKAMRAVSDNVDLAEASGIDVQKVILAVWILAGVLAALGGVFLGVIENVNWLMGFRLLLLMFAGVILGGIGTAYGAMVGGVVVGMITELSVLFSPSELKFAWGLAALVVVLLFRPQGIFGRKERIG